METFIIEDVFNNKLYYFSGVSSPQEEVNATLTQYTTPTGTKISDNSYVNPKILSLQLNTSHIAMSPQKQYDVDTDTFITLSVTEIKAILSEWINKAIKLNITSFEGYHENMYLSRVSNTENELYIWKPNLTFTQVRQAEVSYVHLDFPVSAQENADGTGNQDMGANNGVSAGDIGTVLGSTASGALAGAAIGSLFGSPLVGGAIGAVVGFFGSIL